VSPAWPLRPGQKVRVEFYKYPEEALHYFWEAEVVEVRPEGVLTLLPQGGVFHHVGKGRSLVLDHDAYVAFFPGAWYSGGPDVREGRVLEYYWNVQTPALWTGDAFRQYDLELDVKCRADHTCEVFDREEFLAKRSLYPKGLGGGGGAGGGGRLPPHARGALARFAPRGAPALDGADLGEEVGDWRGGCLEASWA